MSTPTIPPRPQRTTAQQGPTAVQPSIPQIPPRPAGRTKGERSPSPHREAYVRSPLNDPSTATGNSRMYKTNSDLSASHLPQRPPSVSLPSIGQEGSEYSSYDQLPPELLRPAPSNQSAAAGSDDGQTRNVAHDLPLHAPKASVPQATAKSRIQTVTRTDSSQAAAAGIGRPKPEDDVHSTIDSPLRKTLTNDFRRVPSTEPHPLKAKSSFNRSSSTIPTGSTPRPGSVHESSEEKEIGIPQIGMQVPMYPNAGDVQAPSPSPFASQHTPGIGFFNDGTIRAHNRKRSSRQEFGPPGSYGMHGHGMESKDQFERLWYLRHPEEAAKYENLQLPRPETALSSDDLNKLVQGNMDIGMGTSPEAIGTPTEQIGFLASEEYSSRMASPIPSPVPASAIRKRPSSGTQPAVESPLHRTSFPVNETGHLKHDNALESEAEDERVIHIDPPGRRSDKVTGGGYDPPTEDLGPQGGNTEEQGGWIEEHGYGTPILASDEISKRPGSAFLQPAIAPEQERRGSDYYAGYDSDHPPSYQSGLRNSRPSSRPSSRPNSTHGGPLSRFMPHEEHEGSGMGTPLEEIEEYEPLFPEDEETKLKTATEKLKRPDALARHHFPSQDIWEDTPISLQLQTTVDTPQMEEDPRSGSIGELKKPAAVFETPEQEQQRRAANGVVNNMTSDSKTFAKPHFKGGVEEKLLNARPGMGQRFPSHDVWEDTPDSMLMVTTVSGPQEEEFKSPPEDRPTTSGIPGQQDDGTARSTTNLVSVMKPEIPARPMRKSKLNEEIRPEVPERPVKDDRAKEVPDLGAKKEISPIKTKAPLIPDRPKPSVPARPARQSQSDQTVAGAPLAKTVSATSAGPGISSETLTSPPLQKAKPVIPARPGGSKIAALKAGFMTDLESRLKLGPQAPPKVEEPEPAAAEEEKAPLADARKGRAKGPARRKPASSPGGAAVAPPAVSSLSMPTTLWHIDENDKLNVPGAAKVAESIPVPQNALQEPAPGTALEVSPATVPSNPVSVGPETPFEELDNPMGSPELVKATLTPHPLESIGHPGDMPNEEITQSNIEQHKAVHPALASALAHAEPAPASAEELQAKDLARLSASKPAAATEVGGNTIEEPSTAIRDGEEVPT